MSKNVLILTFIRLFLYLLVIKLMIRTPQDGINIFNKKVELPNLPHSTKSYMSEPIVIKGQRQLLIRNNTL